MSSVMIDRWHPCPSGARLGIVDATTSTGFSILGIVVFGKEGRRWTKFPSRRWQKRDGSMADEPVLEIRDRDRKDAFDQQLLQALDQHITGGAR